MEDQRDTEPAPPPKNGGHTTDVVSDVATIKRDIAEMKKDLREDRADLKLCINYVREIALAMGIVNRVEAIEEELRARFEGRNA